MSTKKKFESEIQRAWKSSANIVNPLLSPDQDAKIAAVYRQEPRLFIEPYITIRNKRGQIIPLKFNRPQRIVYDLICRLRQANRPVRLIILKARQVGISTMIASLIYTICRFWPRSDGRLISFERDSADNIYRMIELMHENLPEEVKPPELRKTTNLVVFGNKDLQTRAKYPGLMSSIQTGTARNINVGRGSTYRALHLTEFAYWNRASETLRSLMQTVPREPDTFAFIESSSLGAGGFFHKEFLRARTGLSEWTPVFLPFWLMDEYEDELTPEEEQDIILNADAYEQSLKNKFKNITWGHVSWRRKTMSEKCHGSKVAFDLEYAPTVDEAFAAQGQTLFDLRAVAWYEENTVRPGRQGELVVKGERVPFPDFVDNPRGSLTMWKRPEPGELYVIGADAAMGKKEEIYDDDDSSPIEDDLDDAADRDFCAAVILNSKLEQVAEYRSRIVDPYSFGDILATLGVFYNNAMIMPETTPGGNSAGFGVMYRLKEMHYPNIGRWEWIDKVTSKTANYYGFEINAKTKTHVIGMMQREVMRGAGLLFTRSPIKEGNKPRLIIRSKDLCNELTTFVQLRGGGGVGAKSGTHDDLVIALGLALKGHQQMGGLIPHNAKLADTQGSLYDKEDDSGSQALDWMYL